MIKNAPSQLKWEAKSEAVSNQLVEPLQNPANGFLNNAILKRLLLPTLFQPVLLGNDEDMD